MSLLNSANKDQELRYFNMKSVTTADLPWVREITAELIRAVEPHVLARPEQGNRKLEAKVYVLEASAKDRRLGRIFSIRSVIRLWCGYGRPFAKTADAFRDFLNG